MGTSLRGPWLPFGCYLVPFRPTKICGEHRGFIDEVQERRADLASLKRILHPLQLDANPYIIGDGGSFAIEGPNVMQKLFLHLHRSLEWLVEVGHAVVHLDPNLISKVFVSTQNPFG